MARFYFHLVDSSGRTPDDDGAEIASLEEARGRALKSIRSIVGEGAKEGLVDLRGRIEIVDEAGEVVLMVPFSEAVEVRADPASIAR